MTNKTRFTQKATAARVAKKMGLKEGEFEPKLVGKGQWEIVRADELAPVATESAPGPTTTAATLSDEPKHELVVVDYADQPRTETIAATETNPAPVATSTATESKPERVKPRPFRTRSRSFTRS